MNTVGPTLLSEFTDKEIADEHDRRVAKAEAEMEKKYTVETENNGNGWSYIVSADGYREGPIRYRWQAEEWAEELNTGKSAPQPIQA